MTVKHKIAIVVLLISPRIFILTEWLLGIISLKLFIILSLLYLVSIPSLVVFVIVNYKKCHKEKGADDPLDGGSRFSFDTRKVG